ncbi:transmembrane protein 135-like [Haliotis cracherodii]|uniref:transmembrane protein 135-like n=1 Tax=Haliotis cracherodii TaxID=6455 RepID=UPI0039E919FC
MEVRDGPRRPTQSPYMSKRTKKFVRRFVRGFASGLALYSGFKTVTALTKNPFRRGLPLIPGQIVSSDCAMFATFLGLYPSVYHLAVDLLKKYRGINDGWNYGLAGGLAGLTIIVEDHSRRSVVALFAVARALGAGVSTLVTREHVRKVPYSETMAFCLCCGFLVYCTALRPSVLAKGYYHSILKWSRDYTDTKLDLLFRLPSDHFISCQEGGLHAYSCTRHAFWDFLCSLSSFVKLYLPIHVTPIVIFRRHLIVEKPKDVILSLLRNLVMSGAFLSTMVMLAKYVICLQRNFIRKPPPLPPFVPIVAGFVCGLGVLFERESRRKELALFLVPHSLHALYNMEVKSKVKVLSRIPQGYVLLYSLSMMVVMHAYERHPESLTPLINGLLRFFVGGRKCDGKKAKEA